MSTPTRILDIGFGYWKSKVLLTAVELGIFTVIGKGKKSCQEIADQIEASSIRGLTDLLDCLVALGFLKKTNEESSGAFYQNTEETETYLDKNNKSNYIGSILEFMNERYPYWHNLGKGILTSKPQNEATDTNKNFWDIFYKDTSSEKLITLLSAMESINKNLFTSLADKFNFAKYSSYSDIGGSRGLLAITISKKHPHLKCFSFDLANVRTLAEEYLLLHQPHNVSLISGNFLKDELPRVDIMTMSLVLHNWDLENKQLLLQKAFASLSPNGVLIVLEDFIDNERTSNSSAMMMSLNMLIEYGTAFNFSAKELKDWSLQVGFTRTEILALSDSSNALAIYK